MAVPPLARVLAPLPQARLWLADGYNLLHCAPFRAHFHAPLDNDDTGYREFNAGSSRGATPTGNPANEPGHPESGEQVRFWGESMRRRLVAAARRFPYPDTAIWLVFDGAHPPDNPRVGERPELWIHFAPSADDWIVRRVKDAEDASQIVVVSGDRRLANRARHHGAGVVSPRHFLDHCGASNERTGDP